MTIVIELCDKSADFMFIDQLLEIVGQFLRRFERGPRLVDLHAEYRIFILE
jgi:hypothetical protein